MNESEFEKELRSLRPASPSGSLQGRIAAALPQEKKPRHDWSQWLLERLLWSAGGAIALWCLMPRPDVSPSPAPVAQSAPVASAARVSEEPFAWSDEGVQLVDDGTPARMLRRLVMERHHSPDGNTVVRVPREDVILLPVAFR